MSTFPWVRAFVAGLAGAAAWILGLLVAFGPAQMVLTDPARQSAKMLAAFALEPSPPRAAASPVLVVLGLVGICLLWGCVYVGLSASWTGAWWRRGLRFAFVSWALMVPWFEFYLPWNVLLEPAPLVVLEMVCWAVVLTGVGLAIAGVDALFRAREARKGGGIGSSAD